MQTGFQPSSFQNNSFQILITLPITDRICSLNVEVRIGSIAVTVENGSLNIMVRCS